MNDQAMAIRVDGYFVNIQPVAQQGSVTGWSNAVIGWTIMIASVTAHWQSIESVKRNMSAPNQHGVDHVDVAMTPPVQLTSKRAE